MKPCRLCASPTTVLHDSQLNIDYHVCHTCQYIFKDSSHGVSLKDEKAVYDLHQNSFDSKGYVKRFDDLIKDFILPYKTRGRALDFGSGPGPVLVELLKQSGFETFNYDFFYHQDKAYQIHSFDVITMTEVIEHLNDPVKVLKELTNRLLPGGILVVMTEFRPDSLNEFLDWWYRRDPTHMGFFNETSLRLLLERLELKIVATHPKNIMVATQSNLKH